MARCAACVDAALLADVGDLKIEAALAGADLADALEQLVEVALAETRALLDALVVEREALDDVQWGYAVFDTAMGVPMVCGAAFGGLFCRAAYALPFQVAIALTGSLLVLVLLRGPVARGRGTELPSGPTTEPEA